MYPRHAVKRFYIHERRATVTQEIAHEVQLGLQGWQLKLMDGLLPGVGRWEQTRGGMGYCMALARLVPSHHIVMGAK